MFSVTYLGQQSWLVSSGESRVIVDPVFGSEFGRGPVGARYSIGSQRKFDLTQLPRLAAVIITHEHEDHFHLPSLHLLPRKTPVYLSARSSASAFKILSEMGFQRIVPFSVSERPLKFGSLKLRFFSPDHVGTTDNVDEWDAMAFLAYDSNAHGAFFSPVDVALHLPMIARVEQALREGNAHTSELLQGNQWKLTPLINFSGLPEFSGVRSYVSRLSEDAIAQPKTARSISAVLRRGRALKPKPGLKVSMLNGKLSAVETATPFLICDANDETSMPGQRRKNKTPPRINPSQEFGKKDWSQLEAHLANYAQFLYGRALFKFMYSQQTTSENTPSSQFVFIFRTNRTIRVYEYRPGEGRFTLAQRKLRAGSYLASFECWARDFMAAAGGIIEPRVLLRHSRLKGDAANEAVCDFVNYLHPLNCQETVLSRYRQVYRELRL